MDIRTRLEGLLNSGDVELSVLLFFFQATREKHTTLTTKPLPSKTTFYPNFTAMLGEKNTFTALQDAKLRQSEKGFILRLTEIMCVRAVCAFVCVGGTVLQSVKDCM